VRLATPPPPDVEAAKSEPKPSIALDRWDRGVKPPSYLEILRSMENWDDVEFPDVP
jgi:hypothetical protein